MISGYEKNGYEGYLGPCSGVWTVIKGGERKWPRKLQLIHVEGR